MSEFGPPIYQGFYSPTFFKNYDRHGNKRKKIDGLIDEILADPFSNTEPLGHKEGKDLRGLRSVRIDRNFRILFCVWEEYQSKTAKVLPLLPQTLQEKMPKNSVVFLTVGPHEKAYKLK